MLVQKHVYVIGDVIGVGYRAWLQIQAEHLHIKGWVRNNHENEERFGHNGGVEAILQGEKNHVEQLIELMKSGPSIAFVEELDELEEQISEHYNEFEIRK